MLNIDALLRNGCIDMRSRKLALDVGNSPQVVLSSQAELDLSVFEL